MLTVSLRKGGPCVASSFPRIPIGALRAYAVLLHACLPLRETMVGVCRDDGNGVRIMTLPAGAVLKISKIAFQTGVQSDMVDAQWRTTLFRCSCRT